MRLSVPAIGVSSAFGPGLAAFLTAIENNHLAFRRIRDFIGADFRPQSTCQRADIPLGRLGDYVRLAVLVNEALLDLRRQLLRIKK